MAQNIVEFIIDLPENFESKFKNVAFNALEAYECSLQWHDQANVDDKCSIRVIKCDIPDRPNVLAIVLVLDEAGMGVGIYEYALHQTL